MKNSAFLLTIFLSVNAWSLTALDGVIYGKVDKDKQYDPLAFIFEKKHETLARENISYNDLKLYDFVGMFVEGENLKNTCEKQLPEGRYLTSWQDEQARRAVVSTFQYISLDVLTRAIGKYAQTLKWSDEQFKGLSNNLINNYCSKNLTVYSLRLLKNNLEEKFSSKNYYQLPNWSGSEFYPPQLQEATVSLETRKRELATVIRLYRNICSWNGLVDDYRMMLPYLKNPYIMSYIFHNMAQTQVYFDFEEQKLKKKPSADTVQVLCQNFVCRKVSAKQFNDGFPRMLGSSSLYNDLERLYCHHFVKAEVPKEDVNPQIKTWLKERSLEEEVIEQSQYVSLLTGSPDLLFIVEKYTDLKDVLKSNIEHRWNRWAQNQLDHFNNDLMYEESLQIQIKPQAIIHDFKRRKLYLNVAITLGELDKVLEFFDKVSVNTKLEFSKDFLSWVWKQQRYANYETDLYKRDQIHHHLQEQIKHQLAIKEKRFLITPWDSQFKAGGELEKILTPELLRQIDYMTLSQVEKLPAQIQIPITFYYGNFALKYMRYKFKNIYRNEAQNLTFSK